MPPQLLINVGIEVPELKSIRVQLTLRKIARIYLIIRSIIKFPPPRRSSLQRRSFDNNYKSTIGSKTK